MQQKNTQLTHAQHKNSGKKFPLSIVASDISSPNNVGALFRLCDALAIEKLYLCGDSATPPNDKINKISRSTDKHVNYEIHQNAESLVAQLKASGAAIISLEATTSSHAIDSAAFIDAMNKNQPYALILGSEQKGVSDALLALSDNTFHIPMHGNNSSMNVISAASIACFEMTKNLL